MNEAGKTALLVSALVTIAFLFGIEVGAFDERQRRARIAMYRVLGDVQDATALLKPQDKSPNTDSGASAES